MKRSFDQQVSEPGTFAAIFGHRQIDQKHRAIIDQFGHVSFALFRLDRERIDHIRVRERRQNRIHRAKDVFPQLLVVLVPDIDEKTLRLDEQALIPVTHFRQLFRAFGYQRITRRIVENNVIQTADAVLLRTQQVQHVEAVAGHLNRAINPERAVPGSLALNKKAAFQVGGRQLWRASTKQVKRHSTIANDLERTPGHVG